MTKPKPLSKSKQGKPQKSADLKPATKRNWSYVHHLPTILLFCVLSFAHYYHVSSLFENDRFFSHLSTLEREMTFRTEAGFYYSYYKTVISAPSLYSGLEALVKDNGTEYPNQINPLQRFNVYPELLLGATFRVVKHVSQRIGLRDKECYMISRGQGQSPVQSCVGLGDEMVFYVNCIFVLAGLQAGVMYLLGVHVSGGHMMGGLLSVSSFFFNHSESTRVMWTPPLRENFSFPFLLLQILFLSRSLAKRCAEGGKPSSRVHVTLVLSTLCFVLPWQFSQFVLLTQTLSLLTCYLLGLLAPHHLLPVLDSVFLGYVVGTILQFLNPMLISSLYVAAYLAFRVVISLNNRYKLKHPVVQCLRSLLVFLCIFVSYKLLSSYVLDLSDDAHIFNILRSKFSDFADFHTLLYVCSKEFDFIEQETFYKLVMTLLLPAVSVVIIRLVLKFGIQLIRKTEDKSHNHLSYHVPQFICYLIMAVMLMRLKLFMTPYMCVLIAAGACDAVFRQTATSRNVLGVLLLGAMSVQGYQNLQAQWRVMGEYNNPDQEALFGWVQEHTKHSAVFGGSMPLMANLRLSTGRNIVNHPHYEDAGLRARTKSVYQLFSRKSGQEVHTTLKSLQVQYAVLDVHWCTETRSRAGCSLPDIWDKEDRHSAGNPTFCSLIRQYPGLFSVVYSNKMYKVLQVL